LICKPNSLAEKQEVLSVAEFLSQKVKFSSLPSLLANDPVPSPQ
jgi:hypothetical protein